MKQENKICGSIRCSKCGIILSTNQMGIPTTSIWNNGKYFCWECLTNKPVLEMKGTEK